MSVETSIAIDGPAASGKSTIGQALAERLGYVFFDTGVMYRAVTRAVLDRDIALADEPAVTALAESVVIDVKNAEVSDGRPYTVLLDGEDVTWAIRAPEVNANVSQVSSYGGVREAMVAQQRRIGAQGRMVMAGRDIGTVVLPEARIKIYLDASAEARARRRWQEIVRREGDAAQSYDEILEAVRQRDHIDSTRAISPLRPAVDAWILDSTGMDVPAVVDAAHDYVVGMLEDMGHEFGDGG